MSSKTSGDVSQRPLASKASSKEVNEGPAAGGPQSIKTAAVQENNHNKRSTTPSLPVVEPKVQGVAGDQIATPPKLPGVLTIHSFFYLRILHFNNYTHPLKKRNRKELQKIICSNTHLMW